MAVLAGCAGRSAVAAATALLRGLRLPPTAVGDVLKLSSFSMRRHVKDAGSSRVQKLSLLTRALLSCAAERAGRQAMRNQCSGAGGHIGVAVVKYSAGQL